MRICSNEANRGHNDNLYCNEGDLKAIMFALIRLEIKRFLSFGDIWRFQKKMDLGSF